MHGKWSTIGVPQRGWTCEGVEDLGAPDAICEMCETQEIRYVHTMSHPEYDEALSVGCVCAEKMENDYVRPRQRERALRNAASRRKRWLLRRWHKSNAEKSHITADGLDITIQQNSDGSWGGRISERATNRYVNARRSYPTEEAAKLAAFDGMVFLVEERSWGIGGTRTNKPPHG